MREVKYNWKEIIPQIARMVEEGASIKAAAKAKEIPYKTLYKWYAQYMRGKPITNVEKRNSAILEMYNSGLDIRSIANKVNLSYPGVQGILLRMGIVTRTNRTLKRDKTEMLSTIQKGHAKPMANEKVFQPVQRDESQYRLVPMHDSKRTVKMVHNDDPRTNDQIREEWRNQQEQLLKDLAK